jgi:XisH protein
MVQIITTPDVEYTESDLAVDTETYNDFFTLPFPQLQIQEYKLKLVVYDTDTEEIVRWIS